MLVVSLRVLMFFSPFKDFYTLVRNYTGIKDKVNINNIWKPADTLFCEVGHRSTWDMSRDAGTLSNLILKLSDCVMLSKSWVINKYRGDLKTSFAQTDRKLSYKLSQKKTKKDLHVNAPLSPLGKRRAPWTAIKHVSLTCRLIGTPVYIEKETTPTYFEGVGLKVLQLRLKMN